MSDTTRHPSSAPFRVPSAKPLIKPIVKLLARVAAFAGGSLPQSRRFAALVWCARGLAPVFVRANLGRWHRTHLTSSAADTALFACCEVLDRRRITYDPELTVVGEAHLHAALGRGRGLVLLTVHGILSNLLIRYCVTERGLAPTMVAVDDDTSFVAGTGLRPDVIPPSHGFLLHLRTRLRRNEVVFAMVDRAPGARRALEFATDIGPPIVLTDSMLRLALRADAPIVFISCHVEATGTILRIRDVSGADLPTLTRSLLGAIEDDRRCVAVSRHRS